MKIVTAPHQALRTKAKPVTRADKRITDFIQNLEKTLVRDSNRGVGLAAVQVNKPLRMFAYLTAYNSRSDSDASRKTLSQSVKTFINPKIVKHSPKLEILKTEGDGSLLEGCLSIPGIFGPVPRYKKVDMVYQKYDPKRDQLVEQKETFEDFPAALVQHEIDHLDGILFTDYSLEYDLPVYKEDEQGELKKLEDRSLLEIL